MHIVQDRGQRACWQPLPDHGGGCGATRGALRRRRPPVIVRADRAERQDIDGAIDQERDLVQAMWRRRWARTAAMRQAL